MRWALLLLLAACGGRPELDWAVDAPGRHPVGFREARLRYEAPSGEERTLRIAAWYPAAEDGGQPAAYLNALERPNVFLNADPVDRDDLPLALYSHGKWSYAEYSAFAAEHLASHGFVVLAPEHTGNTVEDVPDPMTTELYWLRPNDLVRTLDWIEGLDDAHPLGGLTGDRVLVTGHSLGGYTALAAAGARYLDPSSCEETPDKAWCSDMAPYAERFREGFDEERIDAVALFAPGGIDVIGDGGARAVERPVLLVTAGRDQQTPDETHGDPYWSDLARGENRRVEIPEGGHHTFGNTCELFPIFGEGDGCGPDFVDELEVQPALAAYVLAFARRHLFGDDTVRSLLDGERTLSEDVSLIRP